MEGDFEGVGIFGEGVENIAAVLSGGCNDGSKCGEVVGGVEGAEGAGDF